MRSVVVLFVALATGCASVSRSDKVRPRNWFKPSGSSSRSSDSQPINLPAFSSNPDLDGRLDTRHSIFNQDLVR